MKCPHCEYEHGWSNTSTANIDGKEGDFYSFPIPITRNVYSYRSAREEATMYACPSCRKMFIE